METFGPPPSSSHELDAAGYAVRPPIDAPITLPARRFHYSLLAPCAKARGGTQHDDQVRRFVEKSAATAYVALAQPAEVRVAWASICNVV